MRVRSVVGSTAPLIHIDGENDCVERRAGFEPATVRLCRPFPWAARAPTHDVVLEEYSFVTRVQRPVTRTLHVRPITPP